MVESPGAERSDCLPKLAVTRQEAARMLSVCVKTLDRLASTGNISRIQAGRRTIFPVQNILSWLDSRSAGRSSDLTPTSPHPNLPLTVERQEAARLLSLGIRLFDRIVASGGMAKIVINRKVIFRSSDLVDWLRKQAMA